MARIQSFRDSRFFPSFDDVLDEHELDDRYLGEDPRRPGWLSNVKHWCLLGEIVEANTFLRPTLVACDRAGDQFKVALYIDSDHAGEMQRVLKGFKPGNTVAIFYALRHEFLDGSVGVRVEDIDEIEIFPLGLADFLQMNDDMIEYSRLVDGKKACHGCNEKKDEMSSCGACKMISYCSKDCQVKGWSEKKHKLHCKALRMPDLKLMLELDYKNYDCNFGFGPDVAKGHVITAAPSS